MKESFATQFTIHLEVHSWHNQVIFQLSEDKDAFFTWFNWSSLSLILIWVLQISIGPSSSFQFSF